MASTSPSNVVSLDAHARARARLTPQESAGVLTDCRDLALGRITQALAGVLDKVEDELFELANNARDRDSQDLFLDARSQAREGRPAIEAAFRRQFLAFFNRKVKGDAAPSREAASPQGLSLMDDDELEQALAVRAMAARMQAACEGELGALSQRFGFLLEKPDLADDANPVSPETVAGRSRKRATSSRPDGRCGSRCCASSRARWRASFAGSTTTSTRISWSARSSPS